MKLEEGKVYKYKEICAIRNENIKTGKSKQLQLENWRRYYEWSNPTSQKFLIEKVYNIPKEKIKNENWGGARENAGRKQKVTEEFNYLFNCFLYDGFKKNIYFKRNTNIDEIYFNNDSLFKFFGCYDNLYSALEDENVDENTFELIANKVNEKARSWIYDKIKKQCGVQLTYGIIAYKTKRSKGEYKDEYLEVWDKYQEEYLQKSKLYHIYEVVKAKQWNNMIAYISSKFKDYVIVKKYHKLKFEINIINSDISEYEDYRKRFNNKFSDEIYDYFLKKEKEKICDSLKFNEKERMKLYSYIINNYIRIGK